MWIHHWVVLQFLHPTFAVPHDLSEFNDRGRFKHSNWADFIGVTDGDSNNTNQKHRLEWMGMLVNQRYNNSIFLQFVVFQNEYFI